MGLLSWMKRKPAVTTPKFDARDCLSYGEEWVIPEEWFIDTDGKQVRRKRKIIVTPAASEEADTGSGIDVEDIAMAANAVVDAVSNFSSENNDSSASESAPIESPSAPDPTPSSDSYSGGYDSGDSGYSSGSDSGSSSYDSGGSFDSGGSCDSGGCGGGGDF